MKNRLFGILSIVMIAGCSGSPEPAADRTTSMPPASLVSGIDAGAMDKGVRPQDDVYRYVWDGKVQRAGVNPYRFAPDAPQLSALRDTDWARINNRSLPTIYPPLAEAHRIALSS